MLGHGSWKPGKTQRRAAQTGISFRDSGVPRGQEPCCQRAANPTGVQPDAIVTRSEATQFPPQRGFAKAVRHSEKRGRKTESRGQKPPQHLRFSLPDKSSAPSVPQAGHIIYSRGAATSHSLGRESQVSKHRPQESPGRGDIDFASSPRVGYHGRVIPRRGVSDFATRRRLCKPLGGRDRARGVG